MNTKQDPCKEFYAFVCGNYKSPFGDMITAMNSEMYQAMDRAIEEASIDEFSRTKTAAGKAGSLYLMCTSGRINEEQALQEFLRQVGLHPSSYGSGQVLDKVLLLFFRYNINTLLGIYLEESMLYNGQRKLSVSLGEKELFWFRIRLSPYGTLFYQNTLGFPKEEIARADSEAAARLTEKVLRDLDTLNFESVIGLETLTPTINKTGGRWTTLVEAHSDSLYRYYYPVFANIAVMEYFDKLYADLGNKKLCLLTAWALLRKLMPLTIPKFVSSFNKFTVKTWCRDAVFDAMEVPLLSWYLFSAVPTNTVRQVTRLATQIQFSILKEIEGSRWIDNYTRRVALDKISGVSMHIGYPKNFGSSKAIDKVYAHYPAANGSFLLPWLTAMKMTMQTLMQNVTTYRLEFSRYT
ncbi:endothelin-converting enzyme 1-like [Haemaphysalis longicornis]